MARATKAPTTTHSALRFQPMSASEIKAYSQHLTGIIRVGHGTDTYGKPWDYAVTYCAIGEGACILMALKGDGGVTKAHAEAVFAEARRIGFHKITWDRFKPAGKRQMLAK